MWIFKIFLEYQDQDKKPEFLRKKNQGSGIKNIDYLNRSKPVDVLGTQKM